MAILTGIAGAVEGIRTVRSWEISTSADVQKMVASNTKRGPRRLPGNTDWKGSYKAYGHTPLLLPGYGGRFLGSFDGENGVEGDIVVDTAEIAIDIEGGRAIEHTVNFSGNGALVPGAAIAQDATDPDAFSAIGCKAMLGLPMPEWAVGTTYAQNDEVQYQDVHYKSLQGDNTGHVPSEPESVWWATVPAEPLWTEVDNVRRMTLRLSAANAAYVSSGTAGATKRLPGNLDAALSLDVYEADPTKLVLPNTVKAVRLYVSGSKYWEVLWGIFGEASGLEVDVEGGGLIGATLNADFTGFTAIGQGRVLAPDGETAFWPEEA